MKKIILIIISFCALNLSAQPVDSLRKSHDFSLGTGYMQMMSSAFLPFGMPAVNIVADYQYFKQSKKHNKNYWGYWLKPQFSFLLTNEPRSPYYEQISPNIYRVELKTGGVWLRKMLIKSEKIRLFVGAGVSLNTEFNFALSNSKLYYYYIPDLNWYFSPDFAMKAEYNFKKVQLKGEISLPVAMVGNYIDQFHYVPVNIDTCSIVKYKLTPNTFVFCNKIFQPSLSLTAKFPLNKNQNDKKKWFFLVKYVFESLDVNLKNFAERKEQHDIKIGFVCEM
ncbi:MAG: hypothetical protein LBN95_10430 [Prevotellaceae bacterium]|jgi:hypothetical protein|nr:hypothetical protein [Prevotellaceae bacterium]